MNYYKPERYSKDSAGRDCELTAVNKAVKNSDIDQIFAEVSFRKASSTLYRQYDRKELTLKTIYFLN